MLVNFIQDIHKSTKRDYMDRMTYHKVECAEVARRFNKDFFDGQRIYGYGGYNDDGRWKKISPKIRDNYKLNEDSRILDIGCGKGFLARDISLASGCDAWGCDISSHCLHNSVLRNPFYLNAGKDIIPWEDKSFDLIISVNTLHNLVLPELEHAIGEINRCSKQSYIVVESYRSVRELHNLECWSLTAEQFLRPEEWEWLFNKLNYKGDYEFIFFE